MNMKRMRGRNHRPNGSGSGSSGGGFRNQQNGIPLNRNHVFDSSGPEMRIRGTAQQLYEKYQQLARDASSNGDRVTGEAYYQHAEHYFRIISAINQAQGQPNVQHVPSGQQPYQNANGNLGQDRNGNPLRQIEGRPDAEPPHGQHNGYHNGQNRRVDQNVERQPDLIAEPAHHTDSRAPEPQHAEHRPIEPRAQETRPQEARPADGRPYEPRRNDQRNRSEFQRNDRNSERQDRFRTETPVVDTRIDISSALEAELAATVAEPLVPETLPEPEFHQADGRLADSRPVLEARAIPIIPDAPPPAEPRDSEQSGVQGELTEEPPAPRTPKPRGRPRTVKIASKE